MLNTTCNTHSATCEKPLWRKDFKNRHHFLPGPPSKFKGLTLFLISAI
jgi:hypothetical protein